MTTQHTIPSDDSIARAWHALSDEPLESVAFGDPDCNCRNVAPYARRVLELFYGGQPPEPDGFGVVVTNPFTNGVWVRAAHPALPWYDPSTAPPQEWCDPTCEDWFTWADLPQPLVVLSPGWVPPQPSTVSSHG